MFHSPLRAEVETGQEPADLLHLQPHLCGAGCFPYGLRSAREHLTLSSVPSSAVTLSSTRPLAHFLHRAERQSFALALPGQQDGSSRWECWLVHTDGDCVWAGKAKPRGRWPAGSRFLANFPSFVWMCGKRMPGKAQVCDSSTSRGRCTDVSPSCSHPPARPGCTWPWWEPGGSDLELSRALQYRVV